MIQDTERHLQARVSVERFQRLSVGATQWHLHQQKAPCTNHIMFASFVMLCIKEMKLKQISTKFGAVLCANAATGLFSENSSKMSSQRSSKLTKSGKAAYNRAKNEGVGRKALRGVFGNTMTDLLTAVRTDRFLNGSSVALYRLMIAFHAVHDLPEAILDERYGGETSGVGDSEGRRYNYFSP